MSPKGSEWYCTYETDEGVGTFISRKVYIHLGKGLHSRGKKEDKKSFDVTAVATDKEALRTYRARQTGG